MAELRELQRKLDSIKALREIVTAMRNLAAIYVRRAGGAVDAIRPYSDVVETALGVVLDRAHGRGADLVADVRCMALVFASDQGLCGTYNDRVVRAAMEFRDASPLPVEFVAIGRRAHGLLGMRGVAPAMAVGSPTSLEGIRARVPELAAEVFETYARLGADEMVFIYNEYHTAGRFSQQVRRVLPPRREDLGEGRRAELRSQPILTAQPADLLGELMEEYFFIQFYRALLESHASENGARLMSMTAASANIDDRLVELTQEFQSVRQDVITSELLDVVGGAEALRE